MARLCLLTAAAIAALTGTAVAADISNTLDGPLRGSFTTEFGTRVWIGSGSTSKNLLSPGGRFLNSRLTYGGLGSGSAELFGKVSADDFFLSGYAGLGTTPGGSLQDEDFPPSVAPFSSTHSPLQNGSLSYLTVDVGHNFYDAAGTRLGAFVGYNYLNQQLNAFGCTQDAANPGICVPAIGSATAVISQTNTWQSLRLGLSGDMQLHGPWTLSGEGAVLPYVSLHGSDTHWLRIPAVFRDRLGRAVAGNARLPSERPSQPWPWWSLLADAGHRLGPLRGCPRRRQGRGAAADLEHRHGRPADRGQGDFLIGRWRPRATARAPLCRPVLTETPRPATGAGPARPRGWRRDWRSGRRQNR